MPMGWGQDRRWMGHQTNLHNRRTFSKSELKIELESNSVINYHDKNVYVSIKDTVAKEH